MGKRGWILLLIFSASATYTHTSSHHILQKKSFSFNDVIESLSLSAYYFEKIDLFLKNKSANSCIDDDLFLFFDAVSGQLAYGEWAISFFEDKESFIPPDLFRYCQQLITRMVDMCDQIRQQNSDAITHRCMHVMHHLAQLDLFLTQISAQNSL